MLKGDKNLPLIRKARRRLMGSKYLKNRDERNLKKYDVKLTKRKIKEEIIRRRNLFKKQLGRCVFPIPITLFLNKSFTIYNLLRDFFISTTSKWNLT